jgi:hypothetical protein
MKEKKEYSVEYYSTTTQFQNIHTIPANDCGEVWAVSVLAQN